MQTFKQNDRRGGESGNVLFLILIAVALFAALSYAVTQSTRSGAGDTASETNLISSAQLTQYPAGVRTSVVRMIIGGVAIEELLFNDPSDFSTIINTDDLRERAVFHPNGGNATYQLAPSDVVTTDNANGVWYYNAEVQIQNIGITDSGAAGNDIIGFLPDVTLGICRRMNDELGIEVSDSPDANTNGVPEQAGLVVTDFTRNMDDGYAFPAGAGSKIDGDFTGQPFGCFEAAGINNSAGSPRVVYYHVLIER